MTTEMEKTLFEAVVSKLIANGVHKDKARFTAWLFGSSTKAIEYWRL